MTHAQLRRARMAAIFTPRQFEQICQLRESAARAAWIAGQLTNQTLHENRQMPLGTPGRYHLQKAEAWTRQWSKMEFDLAGRMGNPQITKSPPNPRRGHPEEVFRDALRRVSNHYTEPVEGLDLQLRTWQGLAVAGALSQMCQRMVDGLEGRKLLGTTPQPTLTQISQMVISVEKLAQRGFQLTNPDAVGRGRTAMMESRESVVEEWRRGRSFFAEIMQKGGRALESPHSNGGYSAETTLHAIWAMGEVMGKMAANLRELRHTPDLVAFHSKLHKDVRTPQMDLRYGNRAAALPAHRDLLVQMTTVGTKLDEHDGYLNAELVGAVKPIAGEQRWYQRALAEGQDRDLRYTPSASRQAIAITRAAQAKQDPRTSGGPTASGRRGPDVTP